MLSRHPRPFSSFFALDGANTNSGLFSYFSGDPLWPVAASIFALTFNRSILRRLNLAAHRLQFTVAPDMLVALVFGQVEPVQNAGKV
ncbi:hypothetical protein EKN06_12360 [Croceicoccus ponticola]|uniref:Uncharacterized protein n=1 Tax=Croceicoccus ponticola TaxID=2217664 RepID=A0A437GVD4_9SPHN|nr:hypothetical protein [Croceicoccus ponticola]RVQ65721.1 hypothetical protein EKN06_12360 [Croceicoccus ponticola]